MNELVLIEFMGATCDEFKPLAERVKGMTPTTVITGTENPDQVTFSVC